MVSSSVAELQPSPLTSSERDRALPHPAVIVSLMAVALLASGAAGLLNEVFWQRSLKRFLGGSESISSTIVVLVFIGGLGVGAMQMGRYTRRIVDPLRAFLLVEAFLAVVNLCVCWILASGISQSVFAFQRAAVALGVPLGMLYAVTAVLILALPCLLMGATMPLASEVLQRRLGLRDARVIGLLFFINTVGSVVGCVVGSAWLMPRVGIAKSLIIAVGLNLFAGLALWVLRFLLPPPTPISVAASDVSPSGTAERTPAVKTSSNESNTRLPLAHVLALGLGFCSLAYQMLLFRLCALVHEPLPYTFSMVLTGFLLFWSLGAAVAARTRFRLSPALVWCSLLQLLACTMFLESKTSLVIDGPWSMLGFILSRSHYFLPCALFGFLFARVTSMAASAWGRDVGRVYAWNTVGSCLGILAITLVGYELHVAIVVPALALLTFSLWALHNDSLVEGRSVWSRAVCTVGLAGALLLTPLFVDTSRWFPSMRVFFGRDGVIGVSREGHMFWDGLWHSKVSQSPGDHVGDSNWWMAVSPVLAHSGEVRDVCVIGAGVGVTAATLAQLPAVERVDAYEINHTLKRVHALYPEGTLHVADTPRLNLIWQDARTGLALNEQKYDVITTAPLYLRQAGAALLNSIEFYRQLSARLKPGGVLCLYAYGTDEQAFAVRQTARQVFDHGVVCYGGYLVLLSDEPIDLSVEAVASKASLHRGNTFWDWVRTYGGDEGAAKIAAIVDERQLPWGDGRLVITDDRPIVEYPHYLSQLVSKYGYTENLRVRPKEEFRPGE